MTQSHYPKRSHSPVGGGSYANNCTEEINKQRFKSCAVDALGKLVWHAVKKTLWGRWACGPASVSGRTSIPVVLNR